MQFRNSYEEEKELKRLRKLSVAFQGLNKEAPPKHTPQDCAPTLEELTWGQKLSAKLLTMKFCNIQARKKSY